MAKKNIYICDHCGTFTLLVDADGKPLIYKGEL